MYIRNFGRSINVHIKYAGLRVEKKYLCPYIFRFVAWFLAAIIVIISCMLLITYGSYYEAKRISLLFVVFIFSLCFTLLVAIPLKISFFSLVDTFCLRKIPRVIHRKIRASFLENPDDPEKKEKVLKCRQLNASLYKPIPSSKLQNRLEDMKYNIELRNLVIDIVVHVFFLSVVIWILQIDKPVKSYYSTDTVKNLVLRGNYTNSFPVSEVTTYETFMKYLKETLLPALMLSSTKNGGTYPTRKRQVEEYNEYMNLPPEIKKRQILNDLATFQDRANSFKTEWTMCPSLKLLGKPRLRQVRVKTEVCRQKLLHLEGRNTECAGDLTLFNVERGTFSLGWEPGPPQGLTPLQAAPWRYRSLRETQSLPILGKSTLYPGGGYVLDLERSFEDALKSLEFVNAFQWVDMRTRVVFVEFTLYCVNTNLFNVVTLIFEKSGTGYFEPTYQIDTAKFMFLALDLTIMFTFMTTFLICFLLFFIFRESVRIRRTTIIPYLKRGYTLLDLALILLGVVTIILALWKSFYLTDLLNKLKQSDSNEFISFVHAAALHNCCIYVEAFLVFLSLFKALRLLAFRAVFFEIQTTLAFCYKQFIALFIKQRLLILAFAFFFFLTLANYSYSFRSFDVSLSTIIFRAVSADYSFDFNIISLCPWYLGLFFGLFEFSVAILFADTFVAVVCLYYRETQKERLVNKYHILEYLKHCLTRHRQSDILQQKERSFRKEMSGSSVMRLKGGGRKFLKRRENMKGKMKKCPKKENREGELEKENKEEERDSEERYSVFLNESTLDMTEYKDLAEERIAGMKGLVLSILSKCEGTRRTARENALKALFCSFTGSIAKAKTGYRTHGRYLFATNKSTRAVYDANKLLQMRKIAEDKAREKGWLAEEETNSDEINETKAKFSSLNEKLCLLLKRENLL